MTKFNIGCLQRGYHALNSGHDHSVIRHTIQLSTTNGVESQNKLLKYSYILPRRKNITISRLATVLYEEFNPDIHHKYLFLNYKTSSSYRTYNDFVPHYLHGRPRQVIIHCLERKSSSRKYDQSDIISQDTIAGVYSQ